MKPNTLPLPMVNSRPMPMTFTPSRIFASAMKSAAVQGGGDILMGSVRRDFLSILVFILNDITVSSIITRSDQFHVAVLKALRLNSYQLPKWLHQ